MPTANVPDPAREPRTDPVLSFRMKRPDADRVKRAADRAGLPLSTFLRRTLRELPLEPDPPALT